MKNAIVYSIFCSDDILEQNYSFLQLRYSIDTLRKFNKDIPVIVYLAPTGILETLRGPVPSDNVTYMTYDIHPNDKLENFFYSLWTSHKWPNTFHALETGGYDNVLYADADTFWQRDPEELFNKYGNDKSIYTKRDSFAEFESLLQPKSPPANDGINLVSKYLIPYKEDIINARIDKVIEWQRKHEDITDERLIVSGLQWLAYQYAVSECMFELDNPVKFFDKEDVALEDEWNDMTPAERREVAVMHYFNYNTEYYVPQMYKILRNYNDDK